jgi:type I restriction enzyme, S subunit
MEVNNTPTWWEEMTLWEVAEIIMWQSPKWESYNYDWNGLPFYQGVTEFQEKYVWIKSYTTEPTKIVEAWTILFSVRAPVWRVNFVQHKACIGRWNAGIIMRSWEQEFLFYLLIYIEKSIQNRSSGTVFDSISWKELKEIPIFLPPLLEQRAIADMLSSLDAKIELLREQNETLEKTAQTIFHEWFGRYSVDTPEELPEGWRVAKIGEVDFITFGDWNYSAKYPKQSDFVMEWIPFISNKDLSNWMILSDDLRYISHEQHSVLKKWHLKQWDILISTRANIWDIALVSSEFEDANINAQLVFIRTDNPEIYSNFLYIIFSSKKYRSIFESYSSWSAQAQLPMHALRLIQIIIPTEQKIKEFSYVMNPIFHKIQTNNSQIQSLSKTRDTLLPSLMSGEVRVV